MAGHEFDPSSPGDSTPASFLDACAPSVSFAQVVSVYMVLSAAPCQDLDVPPAIGTSPVPESSLAKDAISRPPAEPPPPITDTAAFQQLPSTALSIWVVNGAADS
jgi:hypothetical protein